MRQLPSDLLSKINQSIQTIGNNANPKMEVVVSKAKDTIADNSYWAIETIREISGLGDISVAPRRFNKTGRPNRIYEIHVRDGQVYTSIREYPDKLREGFKIQFTLGPGTSVGLAFNGEWKKHRRFYRLITEEKPWLSWIDNTGVLWVQKWDEEDTRQQLSIGVTKVKMIRAWKNLVIQQQDQGIVVAYIKTDGKVYYRNYCIQEDYSETWEYEKELTSFTGSAVNVNLFITTDYRMGFIIEDSIGQIHWLVTPRNWGGMASPAENLITGVRDITLKVIPIKYYENLGTEHLNSGFRDVFINMAEPIYPIAVSANNGDEFEDRIWLKFSHPPIENMEGALGAFSIKDTLGISFTINSIERDALDPTVVVLNTNKFTSMKDSLTITYDRSKYPLNAENQGSLFEIEPFTLVFVPLLTPPEVYVTEYISFGIIPSMTVLQVYYPNRFATENIKANISNISITVTPVGHNPL